MSQPIMTQADLDAYLDGDKQTLLDTATAAVRRYCRWHVTPVVSETVTVRAADAVVLLPTLRIETLTAVTLDGETLAADAYEWTPNGVLCIGRRGYPRSGEVAVTMTHGYTPEAAADLMGVVAAMTQRAMGSTTSNPLAADRLQAAEYVAQWGADASAGGAGLTDHQRGVLDRYRLPPRP